VVAVSFALNSDGVLYAGALSLQARVIVVLSAGQRPRHPAGMCAECSSFRTGFCAGN